MTIILSMCAFSLVMTISPGPVNMIVVSSGVNHGVRQTMLFVSGATIGFTFLLAFIGFGFIQVINDYPFFLKYLAIAGASFIIYMGYKIASSVPELSEVERRLKAPRFHEGFLLQWLNPKAWIACVSGVSLFSDADNDSVLLTFIAVYFLVCYIGLSLWAILGQKATVLLNNSFRLRTFNQFMGLLLIFTACYLLYLQIV